MTNANDWRPRIESVCEALQAFCDRNSDHVRTFFLTGSYLRQIGEVKSSNVNLYFISTPNRSAQLRIALAREWEALREMLMESGAGLLIDCHPYTISIPDLKASHLPFLTITSKVLDASARESRYSLPPTIGLGWLKGFRVLWGEQSALDYLALKPVTDANWFQGVHEALSRYRNLLDHLPWALPWTQHPAMLVQEAFRYAEEAIRDGIPVALTQDELTHGMQFEIYHDWTVQAPLFFEKRYGNNGTLAVSQLAILKDRIAANPIWSDSEAVAAWEQCLQIWMVVWDKFILRAAQERPSDTWLTRVNSFV